MGGIMHMERVEGLQQSVVHRHMLYSVDMEVSIGRPKRITSAEGIGQIQQLKRAILEHIKDAAVIGLMPVHGMRVVLLAGMSYSDF
jgi:hypothetical protein